MIKDWTQTSFFGGFSDDRFMGIENSFRYAKGVEIRKNPNSLTLAYKPEAETISLTDKVNAMVTIATTGDILAFCGDGKIFRKAEGTGSWALVYTLASGHSILNAIEYNDYLYWFTYNKVHRIAVSGIDADWTTGTTPTIDYKEFLNSNLYAHPAVELNNKLYVGDGFYLSELDSLGTWTQDKLEIFNDEEIRGLTTGGSVMRIFSRKSTKAQGGHKYYWDGADTVYAERVYFDQTIHAVFSDGGEDYVIAGVRPFLYKSSGYTWIPLKRLPLVYDNQQLFVAPNAICKYDDLLAFGVAESGTGSIGRGVWTYGKEDVKYPNSLNFDYPTSNDNTTDIVPCVHNSNGVLYFSWKKTVAGDPVTYAYGIDKVNTSKYATSGSLHSRVMYGNKASQEKTAVAIEAAFEKILAGEKIEIFMRKNLATDWESTAEIDVAYATEADRDLYFKRLDDALDIGDFSFLETKIVLTAGTNQATTPEVIELSVEFDDGLEQSD
jgi:hypothetical protein